MVKRNQAPPDSPEAVKAPECSDPRAHRGVAEVRRQGARLAVRAGCHADVHRERGTRPHPRLFRGLEGVVLRRSHSLRHQPKGG